MLDFVCFLSLKWDCKGSENVGSQMKWSCRPALPSEDGNRFITRNIAFFWTREGTFHQPSKSGCPYITVRISELTYLSMRLCNGFVQNVPLNTGLLAWFRHASGPILRGTRWTIYRQYWAKCTKYGNTYVAPYTDISETWWLGAFAKLRKATISFVMSVRPSFRLEQFGFHWTDFDEIWYEFFFFENLSSKLKFH